MLERKADDVMFGLRFPPFVPMLQRQIYIYIYMYQQGFEENKSLWIATKKLIESIDDTHVM